MQNQAKNLNLVGDLGKSSNLLKHLFLFVFLISVTSLTLQATTNQKDRPSSFKIGGKVTTDDGSIPGVNIYLKGTQTGTLSDKDGNFNFPKEVKEGDILVFSFLGYETLEYPITKNTPSFIEVKLNSKSILITGALSEDSKPSGVRKAIAKLKAIF